MSKDKSGHKDKSAKKEKGGKKVKDAKKRDENFDPEELAQSITQAARSMRTALSHSLAESGLYAGQDGVKAPTMTRTIGRMEAQGFVERSGDDEDGRVTLVKLTETGLKSVDHINTSIADCGARAIEGLSAKDIRNVVKLLKAIDANLQ